MVKVQCNLEEIFSEERVAFLSTIHHETGAIQQNAVSWIHAFQPKVLRVAVHTNSQVVRNIESNENVNLSFFYDKSIVSFQSKGKIITKNVPDVPLALTLIELEVKEVHDIMYYGAEIIQEPVLQKNYDLEAANKLDAQVYKAMSYDYLNYSK